MTFTLTCPHCGHTSVGQIQYESEPEVLYYDNNKITVLTEGTCHDCGEVVEIVEYATIDEVKMVK